MRERHTPERLTRSDYRSHWRRHRVVPSQRKWASSSSLAHFLPAGRGDSAILMADPPGVNPRAVLIEPKHSLVPPRTSSCPTQIIRGVKIMTTKLPDSVVK